MAFQSQFDVGEQLVDGFALGGLETSSEALQGFTSHVNGPLGGKFGFNPLPFGHICKGVFDGRTDHRFHPVIRHVHGSMDFEDFFRPGGKVAAKDREDPVGINGELHADPGHAARGRGEWEVKLAEFPVVFGQLTFALQHLNSDAGLAIDCGGKLFSGLAGDGGVAGDDHIHQTAEGFNAEGKRGDIKENRVAKAAFQHSGLNRCAEGHGLIGVDGCVGWTLKDIGCQLLDPGHAGLAADKDDVVEFIRAQVGVGKCSPAEVGDFGKNACGLLLQPKAIKFGGPTFFLPEKWKIGGYLLALTQSNLEGFGLFMKVGPAVFRSLGAKFYTGALCEFLRQGKIEIVAAEVGVAAGGEHSEDVSTLLEDSKVKGAAAQVKDGVATSAVGRQTVGQGGGGRFVENTLDGEAGEFAGPFGGLALSVVEIGGNGDDGAVDGRTEIGFGTDFEHLKDGGSDIFWAKPTRGQVNAPSPIWTWCDAEAPAGAVSGSIGYAPAYEAFGRTDNLERIGKASALGGGPDVRRALGREADHRGEEPGTVRVGNEDGKAGVD